MSFNYTVGSGDSLTKIFLKEAENRGYDVSKKINWNSVMDALDEVQAEEKAEGQALYSGGNDRSDWGNNYVVNIGQVIELAEEQINKIFQAMGLTPKTTTPTPPPAKKDDNPPAAVDKNKPQPTPASEIPTKGEDLTDPTSKWNEKNSSLANQEVKVGNHFIEYDENGYPNYEYDENMKVIRNISRNVDGGVYWYDDYEYNGDGNLTREISRNLDGTIESYVDYEYDDDGKITREISRNPDGTIHEDGYAVIEYKDGKQSRFIEYDKDGNLVKYYDNETKKCYDKDGNEVKDS